jgi:hypothetical protein
MLEREVAREAAEAPGLDAVLGECLDVAFSGCEHPRPLRGVGGREGARHGA